MGKYRNNDTPSDEDVSKRRSPHDTKAAAKRKLSNGKVNAALKGMYNDVVNEPVPDGMLNFDNPAQKPKG